MSDLIFTRYHFRDVWSRCDDCGKEWRTKNAQGVAARHTQLTGHVTHVEIDMCWTYKMEPRDKK